MISCSRPSLTDVSLDEFIETFVPKLPGGLEVTSDFAEQMTNAQAWDGFLPPSRAKGNEDAVFQHLTPIFDQMMVQAQNQWGNRCPSQRWSLITAPTSTPSTPERASTHKPDAYIYRTASSRTKSYSYHDMAFSAEFKKRSGKAQVVDDTTKVLYAMQHMMAVDARRRFIFGFTIEDTSLILWYANRSMLISSVPLDIAQEKTRFIQIFLSFAYASDMDMGFDPSVEIVQHAQGIFYHIMVGNTQYKTVKVLHDLGAEYLLSRAARIFKVKKVGDTEDNVYVLKDLWPEQDRKPEHMLYDEITGDVDRLYPAQAHIVRQHLFTPVNHAFVEVNGVRDNTEASMMRNKTLVSDNVAPLPIVVVSIPSPEARPKSFPTGSDRERNPIYNIMRNARAEKIRHRVHYRIVFKECAIPLHKVRNMGEVFAVLADLMELFRIFHRCGWVHRDISASNVYLYEGRGVLGDLEFAKNTADDSQHEVRTGTLDFMPGETIVQEFLFLPDEEVELDVTFRYNALHDIESTWWLGVWMMHFFKPGVHEESGEASDRRQDETLRLFPGTLGHDGRQFILEGRLVFRRSIRRWIAEVSKPLVVILDDIRKLIVQLYMDLERTFPNGLPMLSSQANPASGAAFPGGPVRDIYEPIQNLFLDAKNAYQDTELVPFKMESPQL